MQTSLFDSFFAPTRIVVVSEERLREVERKQKQQQIDAVKVRIEQLSKYQAELESEVAALTPVEAEKELAAAA